MTLNKNNKKNTNTYKNISVFILTIIITSIIISCISSDLIVRDTPKDIIYSFNKLINRVNKDERSDMLLFKNITTGKALKMVEDLIFYLNDKDMKDDKLLQEDLKLLFEYAKFIKIRIISIKGDKNKKTAQTFFYDEKNMINREVYFTIVRNPGGWFDDEFWLIENIYSK